MRITAVAIAFAALLVAAPVLAEDPPAAQPYWLPPAFGAPMGAAMAPMGLGNNMAPMAAAASPAAATQPGVLHPAVMGAAPMGAAGPSVQGGYNSPFPSSPYTSMYSMSPQSFYSFKQLNMERHPSQSAYLRRRKHFEQEQQGRRA